MYSKKFQIVHLNAEFNLYYGLFPDPIGWRAEIKMIMVIMMDATELYVIIISQPICEV